tara:strand:- start:279 stop:617 length:339 start_codon:yes stop_codon:yes gene_type:complete
MEKSILILDSKGFPLLFKGKCISYTHFKVLWSKKGFPRLVHEEKFQGKKYHYWSWAKVRRLIKFAKECEKIFNVDLPAKGDQEIYYPIGKKRLEKYYLENRRKSQITKKTTK